MKNISASSEYLKELKRRKTKSKVYKSYQLTGLTIADILGDRKHKSLYIKLCKEYGENRMIMLAKDVADRDNVKNMGGYFMEVFTRLVNEGKMKKN